MQDEIANGDKVVDSVTGFAGIVTATATYLAGTPRHQVTATGAPDGKINEEWFDAARLSVTG